MKATRLLDTLVESDSLSKTQYVFQQDSMGLIPVIDYLVVDGELRLCVDEDVDDELVEATELISYIQGLGGSLSTVNISYSSIYVEEGKVIFVA